MYSLEARNQLAEIIAQHDDAPFAKAKVDSVIFIPDKLEHGSVGHYENTKTGGTGIATPESFAQVFFDSDNIPLDLQAAIKTHDVAGEAVTGFATLQRQFVRGTVASSPLLVISRTPDRYISPQTFRHSLTDEYPRHYNAHAQKYFEYIGSIWLPIEYSVEGRKHLTHTALSTVMRKPEDESMSLYRIATSIVIGDLAVQAALSRINFS